ncbi:6729_t:CDS:2 [Ambispora leptoticha]|uniref:6729_t:CDS:1 n=1 Tax=Ambispora leptoticha TaxID=144679 RepID=A0A9N9DLG1_9GLOM|nr:6729_t:CDS:2 [Ambispora leptoticha]
MISTRTLIDASESVKSMSTLVSNKYIVPPPFFSPVRASRYPNLHCTTQRGVYVTQTPHAEYFKNNTTGNILLSITRLTSQTRRHYLNNNGLIKKLTWPKQRKVTNPKLIIGGIILINTAVFCAWKYATFLGQHYHDWWLYSFMTKNLLMGVDNVKAGRWWTMITANFSHSNPWHLVLNCFVLWSFGPPILGYIGVNQFLLVYLASGFSGSLAHLFYHYVIKPRTIDRRFSPVIHSQGASACIMGITTIFALRNPFETVILFIIPMPAILAVGLFAAYDIYNSWNPGRNLIDSSAHLGGALFGALYYWTRLRPRKTRVIRAGRFKI